MRVSFLGLAVQVCSLVSLAWSTAGGGIVIVGVGIYVFGVGLILTGLTLARRKLPVPLPALGRFRGALTRDAVHPKS
jgi:hypothetical protein